MNVQYHVEGARNVKVSVGANIHRQMSAYPIWLCELLVPNKTDLVICPPRPPQIQFRLISALDHQAPYAFF